MEQFRVVEHLDNGEIRTYVVQDNGNSSLVLCEMIDYPGAPQNAAGIASSLNEREASGYPPTSIEFEGNDTLTGR